MRTGLRRHRGLGAAVLVVGLGLAVLATTSDVSTVPSVLVSARPQAPTVGADHEPAVGQRVICRHLPCLVDDRAGTEVDRVVASEAAARPERALLLCDPAVPDGRDDPTTLVVEEAPEVVVTLASHDTRLGWLQSECGEAIRIRVDGELPLVGVGPVTVGAHALAHGLGGGTDEPLARVIEGHDTGSDAAVDAFGRRAIELSLELERPGALERRHQWRTLGRSTERRPAAVRSSGTSTGGSPRSPRR